jgi:putative pyruvate formate lyase activating enzyme
MPETCLICPRECKIDRESGKIGFCGVDNNLKVARAALHFWEEPCVSGENGSGTVFFSGCNLHCVFCQNRNISQGKAGKNISVSRLTEIFFELQSQGALNINLVTPSHYTLPIAKAINISKKQGLHIPIIWNSSGYEKGEVLKNLTGLVDIYMPDFKYMDSILSSKYSGSADYFLVAEKALSEMYRQQPKIEFDDYGIMKQGCLVRHLLLPGCLEDSKKILSFLFEKYGNNICYSIMAQYTPVGDLSKYPELNRKIFQEEYDELVDFAYDLGITNGYIQSLESAAESFIPEFDCFGV